MDKNLLLLSIVCLFAGSANAAPPLTLTAGGSVHSNAGYLNQKSEYRTTTALDSDTPQTHKFSFTTEARVTLDAKGEFAPGYNYGGYLRVRADTSVNTENSDNITDKNVIYISSPYGRLEGGAYPSVASQYGVTAGNIAVAAGGISGQAPKWFGASGSSYGALFIKWPDLITDCDCISYANKISYISPKIKGFSVGASYSNDIDANGAAYDSVVTPKNSNSGFKNILDYVIKYENSYGNWGVEAAFVGQVGKAKRLDPDLDRKNLNAYGFGSIISYKDLSVAASVMDWRKSGVPVVQDPDKKYGSWFWTAGAKYKFKETAALSVTYMRGYRANNYASAIPQPTVPIITLLAFNPTADHFPSYNKNQVISVGLDYYLSKGFTPYLEYTAFTTKRTDGNPSNKGWLFLAGTILKF